MLKRFSKQLALLSLFLLIATGFTLPAVAQTWSGYVDFSPFDMVPTNGPVNMVFQNSDWTGTATMNTASVQSAVIVYKIEPTWNDTYPESPYWEYPWYNTPEEIPAEAIIPPSNYNFVWEQGSGVAHIHFDPWLNPSPKPDPTKVVKNEQYGIMINSGAEDVNGIRQSAGSYANCTFTTSWADARPLVVNHWPSDRYNGFMDSAITFGFNVPVNLQSLNDNFVLYKYDFVYSADFGQTIEVETIIPGTITAETMETTGTANTMGFSYRFVPDNGFPADAYLEYEIMTGVHREGMPEAKLVHTIEALFSTGSAVLPKFDVQASTVGRASFPADNYALYLEVSGPEYEVRNLTQVLVTGPGLPVEGVTLEADFQLEYSEWARRLTTPVPVTFPAVYTFSFADKYAMNYPDQTITVGGPNSQFAAPVTPLGTVEAPFGPAIASGITFEVAYPDYSLLDEVVFNIEKIENPSTPEIRQRVFQHYVDPTEANHSAEAFPWLQLEPGLYAWNAMLINRVDQFTMTSDNFFTVKGVELVGANPNHLSTTPMDINGQFTFAFDNDFHHDQFMQATMINQYDDATGTFTMPVAGIWDIHQMTPPMWEALFIPNAPLAPGTTYEVQLGTFNDLMGQPVRHSYIGDTTAIASSFTVNTAAMQTELPYITDSNPFRHQVEVPVDTKYTLFFSGEVPLSEIASKFNLYPMDASKMPMVTNPVAGTWALGAVTTEIVFTPTMPLEGGRSYLMSSDNNIIYLDPPTNTVEMPYIPYNKSFSTVAAGITVESYPNLGTATPVDPSTNVVFIFSAPVHADTVQAGFQLINNENQAPVAGIFNFVFDAQQINCTEMTFTPTMPLAEGECFTAMIDPGSLINPFGNPYMVDPNQVMNTFCTAVVSPRIFQVQPYSLMAGTTVELNFSGINLDKVADVSIVDEYDYMDSNITVVTPFAAGVSNETATMTVHIGPQAAPQMKTLNYTDGNNVLKKLPQALEIVSDPIEAFVEVISFENPLPDQQDSYGLGLGIEAPWDIWNNINTVTVKGPNLPETGFYLKKVYQGAEPSFEGVFPLAAGVTPEFTTVYTFEMAMTDGKMETRMSSADGDFYKAYPDLLEPNGVSINNIYDTPFTFDHVSNPGSPNAFGNSDGVEEISFQPENTADMEYGMLIFPPEYSPDNKIYNFTKKLKPGIPYNIVVRKPTEEYLTYSINGLVIPEEAGKKPVVAFHFPQDITLQSPAMIVIIPDRLSDQGAQQGGIMQYVILNDALDLRQAATTPGIIHNVSEPGAEPAALDLPNVPEGLYPDPRMPFSAVRYNIPNLFMDQVTATAEFNPAADLVEGFIFILEKQVMDPGATEPRYEFITLNFFEKEYIQHDIYTDKLMVYPHVETTLEPATYRYWIAAERDSDGNIAASPAFFSIAAGATVTTIPESGATIAPTAEIGLVFSNMMDTYSVEGSFVVMPHPPLEGTTPLQGTFQWEVIQPPEGSTMENPQHVMTWIPNNPFPAGQFFDVMAGSAAMPMYSADYKPVPPVYFNFGVQASTGLMVTETYPGNNFKDVPVQTDVRVYFNDNVDATAAAAAFQFGEIVVDETTGTVTSEIPMTGQIIVTDNELRFLPENELLEGKRYGARVLGTLAGITKEAMGYDYEFSFLTYDSTYVPAETPYVMMHKPAFDAYNVPLDAKVRVDFSTQMDPMSVIGDKATNKAANITITPSVPGNWSVVDDSVGFIFTPTDNLLPQTQYTVTVRPSVADTAGTTMGYEFTYSFTTGASGLVGNVPTVVYHYPGNNDTNVYHMNNIFIDFSKPMNHSATEGAITISPSVDVTYSWIDPADIAGATGTTDTTTTPEIDTLNITPANGFAHGTQYTVTIGTGAVDTSDPAVGIPAAYTFKFTTEADTASAAPTVLTYMPQNNMQYVGLYAPVTVSFSKPMDQTATVAALKVVSVTAAGVETSVPGEWKWYNTTADFNPFNGYPEGATIKVTVGAAAADTSSPAQTLGTDLVFTFTTLTEGTVVPPIVITTIPENNATEVPTAAYLTVAFDQPMDHTATQGALVFNPPFQATYQWAGNNLVIMPSSKLASSTQYTVKVTTGATSFEGVGLTAEYPFTFKTSSSTATNPVVLGTLPMNQANNVPVGAPIEIGFNKEMDQPATESAITISPALTSFYTQWGYEGVRIIPGTDLEPGTTYTVRISTGARDIDGTSLAQGYSFTFVTAAGNATTPYVMSTMPYDGEYNVPLDGTMRISFSEAMNTEVTDNAISIMPEVEGYSWWEGNDIVFKANTGALQSGMFYTVTVNSTAVSAAGIPMVDSFSFGFQTAQALTDSKAYVTSIAPMPGMNDVAADVPVVINFSEAMKPYETEMAISIGKVSYSTDPTQTEPVISPIAGVYAWSNSNKTVSFASQLPLELGIQYNVQVGPAAVTESGASVDPFFSSFFTRYDTATDQTIVTYSMPTNGDQMVPVDVPVFVGFNKAPADKTFVENSIAFTPDAGTLTFKWHSDIELEVSHSTDFSPQTSYVVSLNPENGAPAYVLNFKTSSPITEGLHVMRTYPDPGMKEVPLNQFIEVVFSADMDKTKVASALTFVKKDDSSAVAHTLAWYAPNMVSVKPDAALVPGTTYEVSISTAAADLNGNALSAEFKSAFTTRTISDTLMVLSTSPGNDEFEVPVKNSAGENTAITVIFNKEMDMAAAEGSFSIMPTTPGSFSWKKETVLTKTIHKMTFKPLQALTKGIIYFVNINPSAKSIDNKLLSANYSFSFSTEFATSTKPEIVNTAPLGGMQGVPVKADIGLMFSMPMDKESVQSAITILPSLSNLTYEWTADNTGVLVHHGTDFTAGTKYSVIVKNTAKSAETTPQTIEAYSFSFTTASTEAVAPKVIHTWPVHGSKGQPLFTAIDFEFNKAMNTSADLTGLIAISPGVTFETTWNPMGNILTMFPGKLQAATTYTVTLSKAVADTAGTQMAADRVLSFTTVAGAAAPTVVSTLPATGATGVPRNQDIVINFSQDMDPEASDKLLTLSPAPENGVWSEWWGKSVVLHISGELQASTEYTLNIGNAAEKPSDFNGTQMASPVAVTFTTGASSDARPMVTFTEPGNTMTDVPTDVYINVMFSEEVEDSSIKGAFTISPALDGTLYSYEGIGFGYQAKAQAGKTYTVAITDAIHRRGTDGSVASDKLLPYSFTFTTQAAATTPAPEVEATIPSSDSTEVPLRGRITMAFTVPMKTSTVESAFSITPETEGQFEWLDNMMTFIPSQPLKALTNYSVQLAKTAAGADGQTLSETYVFSFATEALTGKPEVVSVLPTPGFTNVPSNTEITATFNMPMDPFSTIGAFKVTPEITGSLVWRDEKTMIFVPTASFASGTRYTAVITTAAKGINGELMGATHEWKFTTALSDSDAPSIVFTEPFDKADSVTLKKKIVIKFSKDMNQVDTAKAFMILPPVTGAITWNSAREMVFTPATALAEETDYYVNVGTTATSRTGSALATAYLLSFSTKVPASEVVSPVVLSTSPEDHQVDISANDPIVVSFNMMMNRTLTENQTTVTPEMDGRYSWTDKTVDGVSMSEMTFTPAEPMPSGAEIELKVLGYSASGVPMEKPYYFEFDTKVEDITDPFVTYLYPKSGDTYVMPGATIEIGFSEPMDSATASGNVELSYIDETGAKAITAATLSFKYDDTTLMIKPNAPLTAGKSYKLILKSAISDKAGNPMLDGLSIVFTVFDEALNLSAGDQIWKKTLEGSLNPPALMGLGLAVITNDAGKAFCLNPDGSKLWEAAAAGSPSVTRAPSVLPGDEPVLFATDAVINTVDKITGTLEVGLNLNTGTSWTGPVTRDEDGTMLAILNSADQMKLISIIPGEGSPVTKWEVDLMDYNAVSAVSVTKTGSYIFTANKISTGLAVLFEYTKSGTKMFETELSTTAFTPSAPAAGKSIYVTDKVSKLYEVKDGVATEMNVVQDSLVPTALTEPVIGYDDLVFIGGTNGTSGVTVRFDPKDKSFVLVAVDSPLTIAPIVVTNGFVYAEGTFVKYISTDETPSTWSYDLGETVTGLTVTNTAQVIAVGSAGAVAAVAGEAGARLGTTPWPKAYGALQNVGVSAGKPDGFIKKAVAESTPFEAKVDTTVKFNAYASVTYRTSDIPEVTDISDDFTAFDDITGTGAEMAEEVFIDTIIVQLPSYLTEINYSGITNLFGDELEATGEVRAAVNEIEVKLAYPIYDSPAVQFRGVNIAFTAKTPASVPTTLDNKIKVIMGSSSADEFVMALEGDGDAGGMIMRNSTDFKVVSSTSTSTAVVSKALLEMQPKMLAANAGGIDAATGKQIAKERLAAHILIPSTATVNPKGVNLVSVVVPSGLVVSGVSISKNGEILKKTTNYVTNYKAGDPIYNVYLVKAVRQSELGTSGVKLKFEFTVSTPDTVWMTPVYASLGYVNDFDKFLGKTGTATTFVMLPPVSCVPGNADGTANNGDGNMVLIQPKNTAPKAQNLTPTADKTIGDRFKIEWESADPDSLVEYRLFYSSDDTLDLTTGFNTAAAPISLYPIFDFNNLSAFDSTKKLSYVWNVAEKDAAGEYLVPAGRYTIYALADDGINPLVQIKSAGKIIVERSTNNNAPEFVFTDLASADVSADATANINFTCADADGDAVTYELYFYPVKDVLRAMECFDASGNFLTGSVATDGTAPTSSSAVWSTQEVPAGSYLILAWYSDGKGIGNIKWSEKAVVVTHAAAGDNVPAQFEWVKPAITTDLAIPSNDKLKLEYKALDTDDAKATVAIYYNTVQAENKDLKLLKDGLAVADSGTSLSTVTGATLEWDTSKLANGFYYLLAKVKENKVVDGSPVPTPALRFWCEVPVLIDKAQESGLGDVTEANLTHNSITISFKSTLPTEGVVKYGVNGMLTSTAKDPAGLLRNHVVVLENLTPNTQYYYSVEATGSKGTYVLNNNGEFYSFKTLAAELNSGVDHYIGGNVGKPNALVTLYIETAASTSGKLGVLAAPQLSSPIVVRTDSSGNWSANVGKAVSADGQAVKPTSNDTVKLSVRTDDGKVSVPAPQQLTGVGAHTSSNNAVTTSTGTLSSVMSHKIALTAGFNLVALPVSPSTKMTARDFLILAGDNALALYHYDAGTAGYKSVIRTSAGSDKTSNFLGDALELDMVKGFFVKMKESKEVTISGLKLEKPQPLSLKKGFNMLTVGYGKNFPFSVKTGTTAKAFLKKLGNDGLAVYSYDGSTYKSMLRTADGSDDSSFLGTDFDLVTGQAYFFKLKNAAGIVPNE